MKIECSKTKLLEALTKVDKVAQKNQNLPVLSCVFCSVENNSLTLKTTNLDVGVEIKIPVKVESVGSVALPAQSFTALISSISDEKINIEVIDGNAHITSSGGNFKLKAQVGDDFPNIPLVSEESSFVFQSKDLVKGIKSVIYAASISTMKPELSSVYIRSDHEYIYFVATDSFRLAEKKIQIKKGITIPPLLIPFKNAGEVVRIFDSLDEDVECHTSKNQISFITEKIHLTSRVVDGVFPDYTQIIPKEFKTEIIILKEDLNKTLKLATIFSDKFNQIKFDVSRKEKKVEVSVKNSDTGEGISKLTATIEGEDVSIGFNHRYINDCTQSIAGDSLLLGFSGPQRPLLIRDSADKSFTYIVMPMNR